MRATSSSLLRRSWRLGWRSWLFVTVSQLAVVWLGLRLPGWLAAIVWIAWLFLLVLPVTFGVGPLGRRINRRMNEEAVTRAKAARAALGPAPSPMARGDVPSGPVGEG